MLSENPDFGVHSTRPRQYKLPLVPNGHQDRKTLSLWENYIIPEFLDQYFKKIDERLVNVELQQLFRKACAVTVPEEEAGRDVPRGLQKASAPRSP